MGLTKSRKPHITEKQRQILAYLIKRGELTPTPRIEEDLRIENAASILYSLEDKGLVYKKRGRVHRPVQRGLWSEDEKRVVNLWYITEAGYEKAMRVLKDQRELSKKPSVGVSLGPFHVSKEL